MKKNIVYLSDKGGCGMWRHIFPIMSLDTRSKDWTKNVSTTFTTDLILDKNYYKDVASVSIQRWNSLQHLDVFRKFIKPICDANRIFLLYHIDDDMCDKHIPLYNRGRWGYVGKDVQDGIKEMLNQSDFLIVTTDYIKKMYHDVYGVPLDKIFAIPNFLPRYWFGDRYDVERSVNNFKKNKNRPRIGIISSLSHYNLEDTRCLKSDPSIAVKNNPKNPNTWITEDNRIVDESETQAIKDDISDIIPLVRETYKDFEWVFQGFCPEELENLKKEKKIVVYPGVPILNYPSRLQALNLQAIVAPLTRNEFNYCKSHIKPMEAAALGVPIFAENCLPYNRVMDENYLFNDVDELKNKLYKFKFSSVGSFRKTIEANWKWLNSPCKEGDAQIKNYWLEDNLNVWEPFFNLRKKCINVSLNKFKMIRHEAETLEKNNTLCETEDGCRILK